MCPHSPHLPQKASGRQASSKASTSYQRPRSRIPPLQRQLKVASPRIAATTEDEPSLFVWNRARTFAPPNHLTSAGMCTPLFSASSSSRSFSRPSSLVLPVYWVRGMLWIRCYTQSTPWIPALLGCKNPNAGSAQSFLFVQRDV